MVLAKPLPKRLQPYAVDLEPMTVSPKQGAYLLWDGEAIRFVEQGASKPIAIEWTQGKLAHRWQQTRWRQERLIKATGIMKKPIETVADYTCGFGQDTMILLASGVEVTAYEREPAILLMLIDAQSRLSLSHPELAEKLHLKLLDAQHSELQPDVIYIDPMFPEKRSALSQQPMQILQTLNGGESMDAAALINHALMKARQRVVVKQPLKAKPIADIGKPSYQVTGKTIRFDVFLTNNISE